MKYLTNNDLLKLISDIKSDFTELVIKHYDVGNNPKYPDETIESFMHGNCGLFAFCMGMVLSKRYGYNVSLYDNDNHVWLVVEGFIDGPDHSVPEYSVDFNLVTRNDIWGVRKLYTPDNKEITPALVSFETLLISHLNSHDKLTAKFILQFIRRYNIILTGIIPSLLKVMVQDENVDESYFDILPIKDIKITKHTNVNSLRSLKEYNKITINEDIILSVYGYKAWVEYKGPCVIYANDITLNNADEILNIVSADHGSGCKRVRQFILPGVTLDFKRYNVDG